MLISNQAADRDRDPPRWIAVRAISMGGRRRFDRGPPVRHRHPGATPWHWPVRPDNRPLDSDRPASRRLSNRLFGRASGHALAGPRARRSACMRLKCLLVPSLSDRTLADASASRWLCPSGHDPQSQDPRTREPPRPRQRNAFRPLRDASPPDSGDDTDAGDNRVLFPGDGDRAGAGVRGGVDQRLLHAREDDRHPDGPPGTPRSPSRQSPDRPRRTTIGHDRGGAPDAARVDPPLAPPPPCDRGPSRGVPGRHSLRQREGRRGDGRSCVSLHRWQARSRHNPGR